MQTFLTHEKFAQAAYHLDNRRLGKQRVEVLQILNALRQPNYGWQNHPAVRMWAGHEFMLADYGIHICREWIRRGFNDSCLEKISLIQTDIFWSENRRLDNPWWTSDPRVHRSHQSNLIRKDPAYYSRLFPGVPDDLPYFWPTQHDQQQAA